MPIPITDPTTGTAIRIYERNLREGTEPHAFGLLAAERLMQSGAAKLLTASH